MRACCSPYPHFRFPLSSPTHLLLRASKGLYGDNRSPKVGREKCPNISGYYSYQRIGGHPRKFPNAGGRPRR
ncbi:hypothetical protein HOY82DRAFT_635399 [Tuber indicum]|nr:hypothetical protein HOY82DRAFT_635399 [Tuber indicum]